MIKESENVPAAVPTPIPAPSLLDKLLNLDLVLLSVYAFLSACDVASFQSSSNLVRKALDAKKVVKFMLTFHRKEQIRNLQRTGDIPQLLNGLNGINLPSLERLYLLENPPRFPTCFFEFGLDTLSQEVSYISIIEEAAAGKWVFERRYTSYIVHSWLNFASERIICHI